MFIRKEFDADIERADVILIIQVTTQNERKQSMKKKE